MRIILIIQSCIILIGAGYWYVVVRPYLQSEHQPDEVEVVVSEDSLPEPTVQAEEVTEEDRYSTSTIKYDAAGPTDTGMEFPTLDTLEVQL